MSTAASDRARLALRISFSFNTLLSCRLSPAFNRWSSFCASSSRGSSPYSRALAQCRIVSALTPTALARAAFEPSSRHFSCSSRIAFLSLTVKCRFDCRTGITKSMMDLPRPVRRAQIKQENLSHKSLTHREETLRYSAIAVSVAGTAFAERCNPSTSSYNSARESQDSALPRASSALNRQQKWTLTFAFGIAVQGVRG